MLHSQFGATAPFEFGELDGLLGGDPEADVICPICTDDRKPHHQKEKKLRLWLRPDGGIGSLYPLRTWPVPFSPTDRPARRMTAAEIEKQKCDAAAAHAKEVAEQREKARKIYAGSLPIAGTLGEHYWREERGISAQLPATMRFSPAGKYAAAVVMPFALPGGEVMAIHITSLEADGRKIEKKMFGREFTGYPLVMAEAAESAILAICEGPEHACRSRRRPAGLHGQLEPNTGCPAWQRRCRGPSRRCSSAPITIATAAAW